jgi:Tfp pilus assembly protein PilX
MKPMRKQRGATLLVALIMLGVLMLFVVSSLNTSTTNLRVVGNMQAKNEALGASIPAAPRTRFARTSRGTASPNTPPR